MLDLNPSGNTEIGSLEEVIVDADNETVDPATLALQAVRDISNLVTKAASLIKKNSLCKLRIATKFLNTQPECLESS